MGKDQELLAQKACCVRWLILDVDGVMTDGALYFSKEGESLKRFAAQDGLGIKLLQQSGVQIAIISGRTSEITLARANGLGITVVLQGAADKGAVFEKFLQDYNVNAEQCAFIGDDVIDIPVLKRVALAVVPANAHRAVEAYADYQTVAKGGEGAVREIADFILQSQGKWDDILKYYAEQ